MFDLVVEYSFADGATRKFWLRPGDTVRVGGTDWADYAVEWDQEMSPVHFSVHHAGNRAVLRDLNSRNGTYRNNQPITECNLRHGDTIRAGMTEFHAILRDRLHGGPIDTPTSKLNDQAQLGDESPTLAYEFQRQANGLTNISSDDPAAKTLVTECMMMRMSVAALINTNALSAITMSDMSWVVRASQLDDPINDVMQGELGGCFPSGDDAAAMAEGIGADALNSAADQMLSQWQVDDESSAAEHIAHKAVNDNKDKIIEAVSDPNGFMEKINGFFSGEAPGAGMPAVRIADLDDGADLSMMGVGNILFESMPVSRITDVVQGPKAPAPKPILEGAATVLSAELPTAFVSGKTAVPSVLVKGAPTILVGGAVASISPSDSAADPTVASNGGPAGPDSPDGPSSGSGVEESGDASNRGHANTEDSTSADANHDDSSGGDNNGEPAPKSSQPTHEANDDKANENAIADELHGQQCEPPASTDVGVSNPQEPGDEKWLKELLDGTPNRCERDRVEMHSNDLMFGAGSHTFLAVYKDGELMTYASRDPNFLNPFKDHPLSVDRDARFTRGSDYDNPYTSDWRVNVVPPAGMSDSEWAAAVTGAGENASWNSDTREYSLQGGDHGYDSGNCHVVTNQIITDAGGSVPASINPPGMNPGLYGPPPPSPPPVYFNPTTRMPGSVTPKDPRHPLGPGNIIHH